MRMGNGNITVSSLTLALYGVSGHRHALTASISRTSIVWEAGWAPDPVRTLLGRDKFQTRSGNQTLPVQAVSRRYIE